MPVAENTALETAALKVATAAKELKDFKARRISVEIEILLDYAKYSDLGKQVQRELDELNDQLRVAERELLALAESVG